MRVCIACTAAVWLTAAPVFAQNPEVTGPRTLTAAAVMCTNLPVVHKPIPRLTVFGPHAADGHLVATNGILVVKRLPDDGLAVGRRYVTQRLHSDFAELWRLRRRLWRPARHRLGHRPGPR